MDLHEGAMPAAEPREGVKRFYNAGALCPAAADAGRQTHYGDAAGGDCLRAQRDALLRHAADRVEHVARLRVANVAADRKAVLGQADAPMPQVLPDPLVLHGIEAVLPQQILQRFAGLRGTDRLRQQPLDQRVDGGAQLGPRAARLAKGFEVRAARRSQLARVQAHQPRDHHRVIGRRKRHIGSPQQRGERAALVDGKVVDHRVHREWQRVLQPPPRGRHDLLQPLLRLRLARRIEDEAHPTARHAAKHPEAPEVGAEGGPDLIDQRFGVEIAGPGDDRLDRPEEVAGRRRADSGDVALLQVRENVREHLLRLVARRPLRLRAQQVLLRDHLQDRADVLRHATVDENEALLQARARLVGGLRARQHVVRRQQTAATDPVLRVALARGDALDPLDAGPDAAGVLPAAAGARQPFAQYRARGDQAALRLLQRPFERGGLPGRAHAYGDERGEQVRRDREARALRDSVYAAYQLDPAAGSDESREQLLQTLLRSLDAGRDDAGGDQRRLQQSQVVPREVEHLVQLRQVGGDAEVHAHESQYRLVDHAQVGLDGRARFGVAPVYAEIDGDVEDARALRVVHA